MRQCVKRKTGRRNLRRAAYKFKRVAFGSVFDLDLVGKAFKRIAYLLPFVHATELERAVTAGEYSHILPHFIWVLGYTAVTAAAAVLLFLRQMKKQ